MYRRKRLQDGTFGELEKVFKTETTDEKVERLEGENASLTLEIINKDLKLQSLEESQASLTLELLSKGVL
ncbi:hypothetical protein [Heyndrickxia oleronia]|uniref:hypothetical protein n=1 Tax=Heyndrickxia oleronia TaxID=38875 RepID=UPI001C0F10FE|nr:hypothetical protein [Heyndrickxia oleronia]MBU5214342.1 hypothetical protein [Heyndrickxia oleronia]